MGDSAQVRNMGCMMALPECDSQVAFFESHRVIPMIKT